MLLYQYAVISKYYYLNYNAFLEYKKYIKLTLVG